MAGGSEHENLRVAGKEIGKAHFDGFDEAISKILADSRVSGLQEGTYEVRLMAKVSVTNPGSIDQYWVDFVQRNNP